MEYKTISNLVRLIKKEGLTEFRMKDKDFEIVIKTEKYADSSGSQIPVQVIKPTEAVPAEAPVQQRESIAKTAPGKSAEAATSDTDDHEGLLEIRSPIVGTFYRASAPGKDPYVKVGDTVEAGSVVCIVEAMKLFNEIESEISGKIVKVMAEDASPVEYDQVLFLVEG